MPPGPVTCTDDRCSAVTFVVSLVIFGRGGRRSEQPERLGFSGGGSRDVARLSLSCCVDEKIGLLGGHDLFEDRPAHRESIDGA